MRTTALTTGAKSFESLVQAIGASQNVKVAYLDAFAR